MPHRPIVALLTLSLGGCAAPDAVPPTLAAALQGVWCNSDDGGRTCWAWDEFTAHGTLEMCGRHDDDPRPFKASAAVTFAGQRMCYVVTDATANFWLQPGQRYCTQIVEVHRGHHVYRDLDTGQQFTLLRRPSGQRRCPQPATAPGP